MTTNNTNPEEVNAAANDRRTVYDVITKRIIEQLNAGVVPWCVLRPKPITDSG